MARKIDASLRKERPKLKEGQKDEGDVNCWQFAFYSWECWALFGWFFAILLYTEIYGAVDGNKERIRSEGW